MLIEIINHKICKLLLLKVKVLVFIVAYYDWFKSNEKVNREELSEILLDPWIIQKIS